MMGLKFGKTEKFKSIFILVTTYWLIQALTCSLTELLRRTGVETDISLDERCNLRTKECQRYIVNTLYGKS